MERRTFIKSSIAYSSLSAFSAQYILGSSKPPVSGFIDKLLPAPRNGGFSMSDQWVWGSSVIKGEDNRYHMFASYWSRDLGFGNWVTNSRIAHAVADQPAGPYHFYEEALPPRGKRFFDGLCVHNPRIIRYKDQYLLYHMGTSYDFPVPGDDKIWETERAGIAWSNKRIGLAISSSVYGPWKRLDKPVLEPRPGHWDAILTSNPAPVLNEKTGKVLLMYKSSETVFGPPLLLGVSEATHPEGPYKRLSDKPIFRFETLGNSKNDVEDPYVWWAGDHYEVIMKDRFGHICGEEGGGLHAWSKDGVSWQLFENVKAYSKTILWQDDSTTYQNHFERPFLLLEDGKPTHLFAATGTGPEPWNFDRTWNMVIPLKTE